MIEEELEVMKNAYGFLYEIENILREILIKDLSNRYGDNWEYIASIKILRKFPDRDFQNYNYHELISYLKIFNEKSNYKYISRKLLSELMNIVTIRNKIAHNHYINNDEYKKIEELNIELKREKLISFG